MTGTPYAIRLSPRLQKQLRALPQAERKLAIKLAEALAINPRPPDVIRIEGMTGLYRASLSELQMVYKIEDAELILLFIRD